MIESSKEWWVRQLWNLVPYLVTAALGLLAPLVLVMDRAEPGEHYWRGFYLVAFGAVILRVSAFFVEKAKGARRALKQSSSIIRAVLFLILGTWALSTPARAMQPNQRMWNPDFSGGQIALVYWVEEDREPVPGLVGSDTAERHMAVEFFPDLLAAIDRANRAEIPTDSMVGIYSIHGGFRLRVSHESVDCQCQTGQSRTRAVWEDADPWTTGTALRE